MYENVTAEEIRARILDRIQTSLQTREGSFTSDTVAAAALEIANAYHAMDALVPMFYVDETSGPYIDRQAAIVGIYRKAGTRAECAITFTGKEGAAVPAGTPFYTAAGTAFLLREGIAIRDGTAEGTLEAADIGTDGNIAAGEIVQTLRNYSGIESYRNGEAEGGTDPETDAALLARYLERMRRPATSGNPYHYQQWANSVEGVGYSRVISKWDGPGTVKVALADPEGEPAAKQTAERCAAYIEEQRPVGAGVTVVPARPLRIDVQATLAIGRDSILPQVRTAFTEALRGYFRGLSFDAFQRNVDLGLETPEAGGYTVFYNRLAYLLLSIPGVLDFMGLRVNGGIVNIPVPMDAVPVIGEVAFTCA